MMFYLPCFLGRAFYLPFFISCFLDRVSVLFTTFLNMVSYLRCLASMVLFIIKRFTGIYTVYSIGTLVLCSLPFVGRVIGATCLEGIV